MDTLQLPLLEDLWTTIFAGCLVNRHEHSLAVGHSVAASAFPSLGQLSPVAALDLLEQDSTLLAELIARVQDIGPDGWPARNQEFGRTWAATDAHAGKGTP